MQKVDRKGKLYTTLNDLISNNSLEEVVLTLMAISADRSKPITDEIAKPWIDFGEDIQKVFDKYWSGSWWARATREEERNTKNEAKGKKNNVNKK